MAEIKAPKIDFTDPDAFSKHMSEAPSLTTPEAAASTEFSVSDFKSRRADDLEDYYSYMLENETISSRLLGMSFTDDSSDDLYDRLGLSDPQERAVSRLRKDDWSTLSGFGTAQILEDAPEEIKAAYRRIAQDWENTDPSGILENLDAFSENAGNFMGDPLTAMTMMFGGPTISMSAKAALAAKEGVKKTALNMVASQSRNPATIKAAVAGAGWAGLSDAAGQSVNLAADIQKEFDGVQSAIAVGTGLGLGAVAGRYAPEVLEAGVKVIGRGYDNIFNSKLKDKNTNSAVDEITVEQNIANETGAPLQAELDLEEVEGVDLAFKDDVEELLASVTPTEESATKTAKFNAKKSRESSKELARQEKEDRLYGGFVSDAQIDEIAEQYDIDRLNLEEVLFDYEANRDLPNIDDMDDSLIEEVGEVLYNLNAPKQRREYAIASFSNYMATRKKGAAPVPANIEKAMDALTIMAQEAGTEEVPETIVKQARAFTAKIGGGDATVAEVADTINQVQQGVISPDTARAVLLKKTQTIHGKVFYGRATKVLTKFKESETSQELAATIRYDAGDTYTSKTKQTGMDYNETWKDYAGSLYAPLVEAINGVRYAAQGNLKDTFNKEITRALRGTRSQSEDVNRAASLIRRNVLDAVIEKNKEVGFEGDLIPEDYFPRLWNRSALMKDYYGTRYLTSPNKRKDKAGQGPNKFAKLLIEDGEAADMAEASLIIEGMLKKNTDDLGPSGSTHVAGNSFFTGRKFSNITDDNKYEEFLDNDIENVLFQYITQSANSYTKKKVLGVNSLEEFDAKYVKRIQDEVEAAGNTFSKGDGNDIRGLYKSITGEGLEDFGPKAQFARDTYTTAVRLSTLPLATISSLTEALLLIQKGGVGGGIKGFGQALAQGTEYITTNIRRKLGEEGLSDPEIFSEMREAFMFLENASVSAADRLGDSTIAGHGFKKINRVFFKGIGLDAWTKTVQLAAYNVGKSLVQKNLTAIKNNGTLPDSKRIKMMRNQLAELNIDVDAGLAYLSRNGGEINKQDPFYKDIKRAASRYTGRIVLDTNPRAAIKPTWLGDPKKAILGELMGYPAAFTNVVLKDFARGISSPTDNPIEAANTLAAALVMTGAAIGLNYTRNSDSMADKNAAEITAEGVARWGGAGILIDLAQRTNKTFEATGNIATTAATLAGPFGSDASRFISYGKLGPVVGGRMPFYGALKFAFGEDTKSEYDKFWRDLGKKEKRAPFDKGGEVNIAQTSDEPDQRIDKMTGRPYDSQAGEAFIDEEDRTERKRYVIGGLSKAVSKTLTPFVTAMADNILTATSNNNLKVSTEGAIKVAKQMEEDYTFPDPDTPSTLEDPEFMEYLFSRTTSLIDEKHDLSVEDLAADYPNFAGYMKDEEGAAEKYSKQRYTKEQIAEFDNANAIEDMFIEQNAGDLQDVTNRIQYQLDTIGARSINTNWESKFENYFKAIAANADEVATSEDVAAMIGQFDPEERRLARKIFSKMPNRALPIDEDGKVIPVDYTVPPKERAGNKKAYIAASKEKELQYRAVSSGFFNEFEEAVGMPNETGLHVGTKPQAERMALFRRQGDEDVFDQDSYLTSRQLSNRLKKPPEAGETPPPLAMMRGYIQVKNPLELDDPNFSLYSDAATLFDTESTMANLNEAVMLQAPKLNAMKWNTAKDRLLEKIQDFEAWEDTMTKSEKDLLVKKMKKADINITFRKMLEDQGFDSVRYLNTADTPSDVETSQAYSYILFKPGQFKTENAVEFDPQDVRHNFKVGGKVLKALKKGAV